VVLAVPLRLARLPAVSRRPPPERPPPARPGPRIILYGCRVHVAWPAWTVAV